jgi:hypothetical protein
MTESSLRPGKESVAKARSGSGRTSRTTSGQDRLEEAVPVRSTMTTTLDISPTTHDPGEFR